MRRNTQHHTPRSSRIALALAGSAMLLMESPAIAQETLGPMFVAPGASCEEAQGLTAAEAPFITENALAESRDETDFYLVSADPGAELVVDAQGASSFQGTLRDPILGLFNTDCTLLRTNDDGGEDLDARLDLTVDSTGQFIIAVAPYADFDFNGGGISDGSFRLTVAPPPPPPPIIGSITVQILDRLTRQPVRGDAIPFAVVTLFACENGGCNEPIVDLRTNSDGRVTFRTDYEGANIDAGSYQLVAQAEEFQSVRTGVFSVGEDENYNIGVVVLSPPPISFSLTGDCESLPAQGGACPFSIRVDNNTSAPLNGAVWSIVSSFNTGSPWGGSLFEASAQGGGDNRQTIALGARESSDYGFTFDVPSFTADGSQFCAELFAGVNPTPSVNTVRGGQLFCIQKDNSGFKILSDAEAAKVGERTEKPRS